MGWPAWLADPNFRWVLAGSLLLGASSGALGAFALLRRRSLMGDVLAHAALPGIALAFLLTGSKSMAVLVAGAAAAGVAATGAVNAITRHSRIKEDTALAVVLTVFYGFGIVLLTLIARSGAGNQAGLDSFILGRAAALVAADVRVIGAASLFLLAVLAVFFHEFKIVCFNPQYGKSLGRPVEWIDNLLMLLIVVAVVIGLKAVGVVLMAAMLILPAVAARYWTDRLAVMVVLAGAFGALSGALGTVVSATAPRLATGPVIVLSAAVLFLVSLILAPGKGLLSRLARRLALRRQVRRENLFRRLFELQELARRADPADANPWIPLNELAARQGQPAAQLLRELRGLAARGLVEVAPPAPGRPANEGRCRFTSPGLEAAYAVVRRHRLWEMFLMHQARLAADHVHRDADLIEHHLPDTVVAELERLLRAHGLEPELPESVHPVSGGGGH